MSYQSDLAKRFFDHPPIESQEEKYGLWYHEIDAQTAAYLSKTEIRSEEDELKFYAKLKTLRGGALLGCVVGHKLYQAFVDFEEYIQEYLNLTEKEKEEDARECFEYHGLNQHLFFKFMSPDIETWKRSQCPNDLEKSYHSIHYVYPKIQRPKFYNIGFVRGFDGVQMDDDDECGMDLVISGDISDGDEEMPQNLEVEGVQEVEDPLPVGIEDIMISLPKNYVEEENAEVPDVDNQLSIKTDITQITDQMLQFTEHVRSSLEYQKTVEQHAIPGAVYTYVSEHGILKRYGKNLPNSSLEKFLIGRCLTVETLEENVPPDVGDVAPEFKNVSVKKCLDVVKVRIRRYLQRQSRKRRSIDVGAKKRILDTKPRAVGVKPASDPAGIDPGDVSASE